MRFDKSVCVVVRALRYPCRQLLWIWVHEDLPSDYHPLVCWRIHRQAKDGCCRVRGIRWKPTMVWLSSVARSPAFWGEHHFRKDGPSPHGEAEHRKSCLDWNRWEKYWTFIDGRCQRPTGPCKMHCMLKLDFTNKFRKDFNRMISRGWNESHFKEMVSMLQNEIPLPPRYRDHSLVGEYKGCRECHMSPISFWFPWLTRENLSWFFLEQKVTLTSFSELLLYHSGVYLVFTLR